MLVIKEGVEYQLQTVNENYIHLKFFHKEGEGFVDGVTMEEIVKTLIDRQRIFLKKSDSAENLNILAHLQQVLYWANQRNFRKVKSKNKNVTEYKSI
jgi:hypothetical protein